MTDKQAGKGGKNKLGPEDIARLDAEAHDEPEGRALRSPGTGGDPEHRKSKFKTDETNSLTR